MGQIYQPFVYFANIWPVNSVVLAESCWNARMHFYSFLDLFIYLRILYCVKALITSEEEGVGKIERVRLHAVVDVVYFLFVLMRN